MHSRANAIAARSSASAAVGSASAASASATVTTGSVACSCSAAGSASAVSAAGSAAAPPSCASADGGRDATAADGVIGGAEWIFGVESFPAELSDQALLLNGCSPLLVMFQVTWEGGKRCVVDQRAEFLQFVLQERMLVPTYYPSTKRLGAPWRLELQPVDGEPNANWLKLEREAAARPFGPVAKLLLLLRYWCAILPAESRPAPRAPRAQRGAPRSIHRRDGDDATKRACSNAAFQIRIDFKDTSGPARQPSRPHADYMVGAPSCSRFLSKDAFVAAGSSEPGTATAVTVFTRARLYSGRSVLRHQLDNPRRVQKATALIPMGSAYVLGAGAAGASQTSTGARLVF